MFRGLFSALLPVTFFKAVCDVRINVCVSVTILSWIRRLPQAAIRALVSTLLLFWRIFFFFANYKTNTPHVRLAYVILSEGRLLSWIAFRTCLRSHSARNNVDRSWTDLRPPPEVIQDGSISKKCECLHSARIKARSIIWDRSSP